MYETRYSDGGYKAVVVASVLVLMQFIMLFGRYYSRRLQRIMLEIDDFVLLLATLFTLALCAIGITFPRIAHAVHGPNPAAEESLADVKLVQASFISWMALYGAAVALSKGAILLLYLRVFTKANRKFTMAAYVIGFVVAVTGIATTIGSIFQCTPIARNWDNNRMGTCIDKAEFARFTAIPNVITGFAMLILPLPMVWQLNVTIQQKVALTATFLHGVIGFAASVARLVILFEHGQASDNALEISIWTLVEPSNYIIVACLPTLRPILLKILPASFFLLTNNRKSKSYSPIKISWPKGRATPKITLASADIHGPSHLTGPWDGSRVTCDDLEANNVTLQEKSTDKGVSQNIREITTPSPKFME